MGVVEVGGVDNDVGVIMCKVIDDGGVVVGGACVQGMSCVLVLK